MKSNIHKKLTKENIIVSTQDLIQLELTKNSKAKEIEK